MNPRIAFACLSIAGVALATPPDAPVPTPTEALARLQQGNERFAAGSMSNPHTSGERVAETSSGQHPFAAVLGCADSRVPVERVFDQGIGDVFTVRVAGNVANTDEIGSVEYAAGHMSVPLLVVLGHTKCGAVTAVVNNSKVSGSIPGLISNIIPAVESARREHPDAKGEALIGFAIDSNVLGTMKSLLATSDELRNLVREGKLQIVGAVYSVESGKVRWLGGHPDQTALLAQPPAPASDTKEPKQATVPETPSKADAIASGTESVSISSSGRFAKPDLKLPELPAFGPKSGTPAKIDHVEELTAGSNASGVYMGVAAGVSLIIVVVASFLLSNLKKSDGSRTRGLTLGTKLSIGFGGAVVMIMAVAAISITAQDSLSSSTASVASLSQKNILSGKLVADLAGQRIALRDFLLNNTAESVQKSSNAAATLEARLEEAKDSFKVPARAAIVKDIDAAAQEYFANAGKLIGLIAERNGVIDSQVGPTAARATDLLKTIVDKAQQDGELRIANQASSVRSELLLARLNFFKFLRSHADADSTAAEKAIREGLSQLAALDTIVKNPASKASLAEIREAYAFYSERVDHVFKLADQRDQVWNELLTVTGPKMVKACVELETSISGSTNDAVTAAKATAASTRSQTMLIVGFAAAGVCLLSVFLVRNILKSTSMVLGQLTRAADGDLTMPPSNSKANDELGELSRATDRMSQSLRNLVGEVLSSTRDVAAAATEIAASSEEMASGMRLQQEQATQVSAAIEEMSASVSEVARQSSQAATNAAKSGTLASEGSGVVANTVTEMKTIATQVQDSARAIGQLGKKSEQIGQIIGVINDIAEQTNLLALNAAIEAARAGEHGKGFAVVADEVRKLAERTTTATKQVSDSIREIQDETTSAVTQIEGGSKRVSTGVQLANSAGVSLQAIVESSQGVNTMITSIAAAAEQQSSASEEITRSMAAINSVTKESAQAADQAAQAASQLSLRAETLQSIVTKFRI